MLYAFKFVIKDLQDDVFVSLILTLNAFSTLIWYFCGYIEYIMVMINGI